MDVVYLAPWLSVDLPEESQQGQGFVLFSHAQVPSFQKEKTALTPYGCTQMYLAINLGGRHS